jgi:hypothetical protein
MKKKEMSGGFYIRKYFKNANNFLICSSYFDCCESEEAQAYQDSV